ncbi:MAG: hypothetical protein J6Y91_04845, partial [Alphaproteobacteria bacterium]|nr:hypothetical protein [Alphaproteobacteria bacterium]
MKKWTLNLADIFFKHTYFLTALLTVAVLFAGFGVRYVEVGHLFYDDTDSYMRLLRISDWLANFEWSERLFPYTNPPSGFELHFTRIMDVIWVVLSVPFMVFMPLKEALFYGGYLISPLFLVLVMFTLVQYYKAVLPPMHGQKIFFLFGVVYSLMLILKLSDVFDFYRPDHHAVMCFFFVYNVCVILHGYRQKNLWQYAGAGFLIGLGVWASSAIEGFMIVAALLSVLCVEWIFGQRSTKYLVFYTLGFFAALTLAWLINPPLGGLMVLNNTRLSLIHVVAAALIFLSFLFIDWRHPHRTGVKIIYLVGTAAVSIMLMILIFGWKQFTVPVYQPLVKQYFLPHITEMFPAWKFPFLIYSYIFCWVEIIILLALSKFRLPDLNLLAFLTVFISIYSLLVVRFYPYFLMLY